MLTARATLAIALALVAQAPALALVAQVPTQAPAGNPPAAVPLYDNLGAHHLSVSTREPAAQPYFDQGLRLYYAFNHQESIRAFREAERLDPQCAMCWWGEALAWGPNINMPMDSAGGVAAHAAITRAVAAKAGANEVERALIDALATRYTPVPPADRAHLDTAYARAMTALAKRFPQEARRPGESAPERSRPEAARPDESAPARRPGESAPERSRPEAARPEQSAPARGPGRSPEVAEVAVLYAESQMDLRPWNYWTAAGEPQPGMAEALAALEQVIALNPQHPGACHFYIHAVEAVHPERAVPCAERLAALMPGAGHLVHMPAHIYVRVGRYADAIQTNEHAVHADESYIRDHSPSPGIYTAGYYPHNYDFLAFAASMAGRRAQAVSAADKVASLIAPDLLGVPGLDFLQHHMTRQLQLRIRFGLWDEILRAPAPPPNLPHATAIWHYARGRALAAQGKADAAEAELAQLRTIAASDALQNVKLEYNLAPAVLNVAVHTLAGHIAAARRDYGSAADHLGQAATLEDGLVYGEPPEWSIPVRQELGVVLLTAGKAPDAERAFRDDLKRFPENGWSLHGLARALRAQGRTADAAAAEARFRKAWEGADTKLDGDVD